MSGATDDSKRCPKCGTAKPPEGFHRNKGRADGLAVWCKTCVKAYARAYNQRDNVKKANRRRGLDAYHALPEEEKKRRNSGIGKRDQAMRRKYGLTHDEYLSILESQGGGCAMCGRLPEQGKHLCVDHDHACCPEEFSCGKCVRGVLCVTCNVWLGYYEDERWNARAAAYLESSSPDREIARIEGELD